MSMSEELEKRLSQRPDQWTLAWWDQRFEEILKGYRGATHAVNCCLATQEDVLKAVREMKDLILAMEADRAKIGELQARVDRMAEFLRKKHGTEATPKTT